MTLPPLGAATAAAHHLSSPLPARGLRVAWFSPMPPSPSGIAAYSAEVLPLLRARGVAIDVFTELPGAAADGLMAARDFVWMQRRRPYDLTVYQLGNARCHDYMWGYLFRYPGLVVLHDAQIHQARAQSLLQRWKPRRDDYLAEFRANHPDAPPDLGLLFEAGLGGSLYGHWPLVRLVLQGARLAAVHSPALARRLHETWGVEVAALPMGVPDPLDPPPALSPAGIRARHGVPDDAVVVGAVGGVTPEKRLPELLAAMAALGDRQPALHLLVVGAAAAHYDIVADAAARGLSARVHVTGFVEDAELGAYLAAIDICACMRWPSNGETSASWWRAMAAGRATIVTDLVHQPELPVLDPRGWRALGPAGTAPVAVAIPILDEHKTIVETLDVLGRSALTRTEIGDAARRYWKAHHTLGRMAEAYEALLPRAAARTAPAVELPAHLRKGGDEHLMALLAPFGVDTPAGVSNG
jgi:glycosyltransferase involved in cell wall biosynthesis